MSLEQIKAALLRRGEMSSIELQGETGCSRSGVNEKLLRLIAAGEVHISGYRYQIGVQGRRAALYSVGSKKAKRVRVAAPAVRPSAGMWGGLMA